jgi:hypothetical protein
MCVKERTRLIDRKRECVWYWGRRKGEKNSSRVESRDGGGKERQRDRRKRGLGTRIETNRKGTQLLGTTQNNKAKPWTESSQRNSRYDEKRVHRGPGCGRDLAEVNIWSFFVGMERMEDFGGGELFWMDQHEHGAGGDTPRAAGWVHGWWEAAGNENMGDVVAINRCGGRLSEESVMAVVCAKVDVRCDF